MKAFAFILGLYEGVASRRDLFLFLSNQYFQTFEFIYIIFVISTYFKFFTVH